MKHIKLFIIGAIACSIFCQCISNNKSPKYVFFIIGDGMGVNQVLGTQMYVAEKEGKIGRKELSFTSFPQTTIASTYSQYNAVTCSAASGTALACGEKTKNGAIGMDSLLSKPLFSVAQKLRQKGKNVGIVTSVSIDHATPAAFYAHQPHRSMYYDIALDAAKSDFDFFGGAGFLQLQKDTNSVNVLTILQDSNYFIAKGIEEYNRNHEKIVLLQDFEKENLDFAIDRENQDLSLSNLVSSALDFLTKEDNGFFLMIEGGLIDWACHSNDAATVFAEVEDLSNTMNEVLRFYHQHPDETLIILTADHETGGLSLGTGDYQLNLSVLQNQKKSAYKLNEMFNQMAKEKGENICWEDVKTFLEDNFGFWKNVELTKEETNELRNIFEKRFLLHQNTQQQTLYLNGEQLISQSVKILNKKANIGWSSYGHSAGFVPVFAIGLGAEKIQGIMDNTDFYQLLTEN